MRIHSEGEIGVTMRQGAMAQTEPDAGRRHTVRRDHIVRDWGWQLRRRHRSDLGRWPFRAGICASLATAAGIGALLQRDAFDPPQWGVIGLVVVAVLPWIVDLLLVEVPPRIFAPVVIVPVAILHDPSQFDPLQLVLAVLALDMGLWLGAARSAPIVVVSAAIVVGQAAAESVSEARFFTRPLGAIAGAWLVGLALHSQVMRIARLRSRQHELVEQAARAEPEHVHTARDVYEHTIDGLEAILANLAASRAALERGDIDEAKEGASTAEQLGRATIDGLQRRLRAIDTGVTGESGRPARVPSEGSAPPSH